MKLTEGGMYVTSYRSNTCNPMALRFYRPDRRELNPLAPAGRADHLGLRPHYAQPRDRLTIRDSMLDGYLLS